MTTTRAVPADPDAGAGAGCDSGSDFGSDYLAVLAGLDRPPAGDGPNPPIPPQRRAVPAAPPALLAGEPPAAFTVMPADAAGLAAHRRLRRAVFVDEQGLFAGADESDDTDDDPRTVVLVARGRDGTVLGGVRIAPATEPDVGWWHGSRLVVVRASTRPGAAGTAPGVGTARSADAARGVGAALVRAACAYAEAAGALRFDASVQPDKEVFFARLGWRPVGSAQVAGRPHVRMRWPVGRVASLVDATKSALGGLLAGLAPGGPGFVGDDGAPVPGSDLVAACDAVLPSMVRRDPGWAGWCGVLVNVNDLAAMGATPVGLLDAVSGRDTQTVGRVLAGLRAASDAYGVPILGGHTQLGVPEALSVTALGRARTPVRAGGGQAGDDVAVVADLAGTWRPGYGGRQWDSTTVRRREHLRSMVTALAQRPTAAAKDVSMAGLAGTLGMLAEASGCGAELDVAAVPRPAGATLGDWLTCFPGFALVTADRPGAPPPAAAPATAARCGRLVTEPGVRLRWPDGETTVAVPGPVTGLGPA